MSWKNAYFWNFTTFTVGDGYCNDENNIKECLFDGQDCCDVYDFENALDALEFG